jgi:hypothetical protein
MLNSITQTKQCIHAVPGSFIMNESREEDNEE